MIMKIVQIIKKWKRNTYKWIINKFVEKIIRIK
jgi:hypothetical protein